MVTRHVADTRACLRFQKLLTRAILATVLFKIMSCFHLHWVLFSQQPSGEMVVSHRCKNSKLFEEHCWSLFNTECLNLCCFTYFTFHSPKPRGGQSKHPPSCLLSCDLWPVIFSKVNKHPDICSLYLRFCCCAYWWSSWPWRCLWGRAVMPKVGNDDRFSV